MIGKLFIIFSFLIVSCENNRSQELSKEQPSITEADENITYQTVTATRGGDLVEQLYVDVLKKNAALKQLEVQIVDLEKSRNDSLGLFNYYDMRNEAYFKAADQQVSAIKDSSLRDNMKLLLAEYTRRYQERVARHRQLLATVTTNDTSISDLHTLLKLVNTLPLIERYQKQNLPDTQSIAGYVKKQTQTLQLADSLSKK